ncbi:DUF7088 domain-containing protein [Sorangium sp. So ce1099]|uniref:DUF7088 domain-containing protein n=1 Tax=Sorangium sp. So ce1099 TaxID=3133331 RepID=UPI003F5D70DA
MRLLSSLRAPLQIDLYASRGRPNVASFAAGLKASLDRYSAMSGGHITVRLMDVKDAATAQQAMEAGLEETSFDDTFQAGGAASPARGYLGVALECRSAKGTIPAIVSRSPEVFDFWIMNKIREIHDRADRVYPAIGAITGKDEIEIGDANLVASQPGQTKVPSIRDIVEKTLPFYRIEEVGLAGGDVEIDKALAGLIITQPAGRSPRRSCAGSTSS